MVGHCITSRECSINCMLFFNQIISYSQIIVPVLNLFESILTVCLMYLFLHLWSLITCPAHESSLTLTHFQ